jgi:hypothetical protein
VRRKATERIIGWFAIELVNSNSSQYPIEAFASASQEEDEPAEV